MPLASLATDVLTVVMSAVALVVAIFAAWQAKRSADAASRSESHGGRAAAAAEASAAQAARSADAAERGVQTQEAALEIERGRAAAERVAVAKENAPVWEAAADGPEGAFRLVSAVLEGKLRNGGLVGAEVDAVVLDLPSGGRLPMDRRREPLGPGSGGWESQPHIPPGGILALRCELGGEPLVGDARPSVYIDFRPSSLVNVGQLGATIELLRAGTGVAGDAEWKVGRIRPGLLA